MFIWDYNAIFACLVFVVLGVVFAFWMAYTLNKDVALRKRPDAVYFRQCQYCAYVYMDYLKQNPCRCPRCRSYHD